MSDRYILDGQGQPERCEDLLTWASWYEEDANRRVARDSVGDAELSTVFLGLDHSFGRGAPILYESMVFGGPLDGEEQRYHTRDEAVAGHAALLERIKEASRESTGT